MKKGAKVIIKHKETNQEIHVVPTNNDHGYRELIYLAAQAAKHSQDFKHTDTLTGRYSPSLDKWATKFGVLPVKLEALDSLQIIKDYGFVISTLFS